MVATSPLVDGKGDNIGIRNSQKGGLRNT